MSKLMDAAALATVALITAAPGAWGEQDNWVAKWSNGHKMESSDGKFALKFGGRIQADYTFVSEDDALAGLVDGDGFEFRRARLFFEGEIYERIKFKAQYDFAGGDAEFKDVYVGLITDWGDVLFGHFKEPFSLEEMTSSKDIAFLERSMPVEAFVPSRNSGIEFFGDPGERLNWGVGAFYDADDFGISENEDRINLTGRIVFRPLYEDKGKRMFHVGLSATQKEVENGGTLRFRARPEVHLSSRFVDTGSFAADSALIYDLELAAVLDRFWFAGEFIQADVDAPAFGDPTFGGFYIQLGFFLTDDYRRYKTGSGAFDRQKPSANWDSEGGRGAWEIAGRFSTLDLDDGSVVGVDENGEPIISGVLGGEQDNVSLALNWYPNPATRWMLNFVHADADGLGEADFIITRWQVDF